MTPAAELELDPEPGIAFTPDGVFERAHGRWTLIGREPQMNHHIEVEAIEVPLVGRAQMGYKRGRESVSMTVLYRGDRPADRGSRIVRGEMNRYHPGESTVQLTVGMGPLPLKLPRRTKALVLWG